LFRQADTKNDVSTQCHTAFCRDSILAVGKFIGRAGRKWARGNKSPRYYGWVSLHHATPHFAGTAFLESASRERVGTRARGAKAAALRVGRAERRSRKAGKPESRKACYSVGKVRKTGEMRQREARRGALRGTCLKQWQMSCARERSSFVVTGQASQTLILTGCRRRTPHRKVSRTYTFTAPTNIPTARTKQLPEKRQTSSHPLQTDASRTADEAKHDL